MTQQRALPDDNSTTQPAAGVREELVELMAGFSSLLSTRVELARLEYVEARRQTLSQMVRFTLAAFLLGMAFLVANALLVVSFWETPYRIAVMGWMVGIYAALGILALWRLSVMRRRTSKPFSATLGEFKKDRKWLVAALQPKTTTSSSMQEPHGHA